MEKFADDDEAEQAFKFLKKYMPKTDQATVSDKDLTINAHHALAARQATPWAEAVPFELFLNYVLPYRQLDEPLDKWRPLFRYLFTPLVASSASITDAAQTLNKEIWSYWGIHFVPDQTPEIMSPSQVIKAGYASCTGLSIFLADALRAVGIPARVAGTPSWVSPLPPPPQQHNHLQGQRQQQQHNEQRQQARPQVATAHRRLLKAGVGAVPGNHEWNNHNWVEVWDSGRWSFVGAAEYDPRGMNLTWFFPQPAKSQIPGSREHAIYAASFAPLNGTVPFPLVWSDSWQQAGYDVTQAYLDAAVLDES